MKKLKKLLSLVLCLVMVAPVILTALPVTAAIDYDKNITNVAPVDLAIYATKNPGDPKDYKLETGKEYATRIHIGAEFSKISLLMATYGKSGQAATLTVYKWETSYSNTKSKTPIKSERFNLQDNKAIEMSFSTPLAAGEYLFVMSDTTDNVAVWSYLPATSGARSYENGAEARAATRDWSMTISFTKTPIRPTYACYDPEVTTSNDSKTVYAYTKSLLHSHSSAPVSSTYGIRLNFGGSFDKVIINIPTYKTSGSAVTFNIYEWRGKYDYTVSFDPIYSERLTNIEDGIDHIFDFGQVLPAGEYFIEFDNPKGSVGVWEFRANSKLKDQYGNFTGGVINGNQIISGGLTYKGAMESTNHVDWQMKVHFVHTPKTYFYECYSAKPITGDNQPPKEPNLAEDPEHITNTHKVDPTTWVFTDGLGRPSLTNKDVGGLKSDKTLGMFYWMWHTTQGLKDRPVNTTSIINKYPEAKNDYYHAAWPSTAHGQTYKYFWDEPIYGYYHSNDTWVLRKQAELLANAGVDVVFSDNSNGLATFSETYPVLYTIWDEALETGAVKSPKVSYIFPFEGSNVEGYNYSASELVSVQLSEIYLSIYHPEIHKNLWFYWDGKPLMMTSHTQMISLDNGVFTIASIVAQEIRGYFTFRDCYARYYYNTRLTSGWGWLNAYPQAHHVINGVFEQITVSVAQNALPSNKEQCVAFNHSSGTMGRSYTTSDPNRYTRTATHLNGYYIKSEESKWGHNFDQQFNYALRDGGPKLIFVTGWNEWVAGRYENLMSANNALPDQFNGEYSRDIEPSKGELKDHYYYQLVNFSRRYKGCNPIPEPNSMHSIDIYGNYNINWNDVEPFYAAYKNNVSNRDNPGYGYYSDISSGVYYTETSGRNDIVGMKMARDKDYLYVDIECDKSITDYTDNLWMNLYLDTNQSNKGWETFDYVINKTTPIDEHTAILEKFTGNGYKSTIVGEVEFNVRARHLTMKIKRSDLGLTSDNFTINFAATDNVHDEHNVNAFTGDIMDFYISGDVAPGGRFKYSFTSTTASSTHTCMDTDDHNCDYCGVAMANSVCSDSAEDDDHECDLCGATLTKCSDDVEKNHRCDVCGERMSECEAFELDGHFCSHCGKRITKCEDCDLDPVDHLCDVCGIRVTPHVDTDPADHLCDICGSVRSQCVDQEPADHICDICGTNLGCYDKDDHKCDVCGEVISECADIYPDHYCDVCGEILSYCTDAETPDHNCDICGWVGIGCSDNNDDHLCDACSTKLSSCRDKDKDHFCDKCGERLHDCADWDDHVCDWCGQPCSDCADGDSNHKCDTCNAILSECGDEDSDHKCDVCDATLSECGDEDGDGQCDVCGEDLGEDTSSEEITSSEEESSTEEDTRPSKLPAGSTEASTDEETETSSETESESEETSEENDDDDDDDDEDNNDNENNGEDKKDGCSSAIGGITVATVMLIGSALVIKKKKDLV